MSSLDAGLVVQVLEVGFPFQDFPYDTDHLVGFGHLVLPCQLLPDGTMLLNHDPPFALIPVRTGLIGIASNADEIRASFMFCFYVPAPILLIRIDYLYSSLDKLATKPGGNVLAETAGVYEVIFRLREVKSIRLEQKIMAHTASFR